MKRIIYAIALPLILLVSQSAYCQNYKTLEDTARLNLEYLKVTRDISDLNIKLSESQENLKKYQSNVASRNNDAQSSAEASSDQASKATNGGVKDARRAKRKAKAAYKDSKQSRGANDRMNEEERRMKRISSDLQRRQERLQELDRMRAAITNQN